MTKTGFFFINLMTLMVCHWFNSDVAKILKRTKWNWVFREKEGVEGERKEGLREKEGVKREKFKKSSRKSLKMFQISRKAPVILFLTLLFNFIILSIIAYLTTQTRLKIIVWIRWFSCFHVWPNVSSINMVHRVRFKSTTGKNTCS